MKNDIVYKALYNGMIHESSYATLSLHWTKEGAAKAIELHKMEVKGEYDESVAYWKARDPDYSKRYKWDDNQDWYIKEVKILE